MEFRFNRISFKGNHNIILQDVNGDVVRETLEQFVRKFTAEKDEQIRFLQQAVFDTKRSEQLGDDEIRQLNEQLQQLLREKEALEKQIGNMVDGLTLRDISNSGVIYQQAFALFLQAKPDDALKILSNELLEAEQQRIMAHNDHVAKARQNLADTFVLKGEILELKFLYEEAGACYHKALQILATSKYFRILGQYYEKQLYYEKAETFFELAVLRAQTDQTKAVCLGNLGKILKRQNKLPVAEAHFREALAICRRKQAIENTFLKQVITATDNLILLLLDKGELDEAQSLCDDALAQIHSATGQVGEDDVWQLNTMYGAQSMIYHKLKQYNKAELSLQEAVAFSRRLALKNPKIHTSTLLRSLANLAFVLTEKKDFESAEQSYGEVIEGRRERVRKNPQQRYLSELAGTLGMRGNMLVKSNRFSEGLRDYNESLEIYQQLVRLYPKAYRGKITFTLNNLAHLQTRMNKVAEAERNYSKCAMILRDLAGDSPTKYGPELAIVLMNFARLQVKKGVFSKAEELFSESLELLKTHNQLNPGLYDHEIAGLLDSLANLTRKKFDFQMAEEQFDEAISIYQLLTKRDSQKYAFEFSFALQSYGMFFISTGDYTKAEQYLEEAFDAVADDPVDPDRGLPFARSIIDLKWAHLEALRRNYEKSEGHYQKALEVRRRLFKEAPELYTLPLMMNLNNYAYLKVKQQDFQMALQFYEEASKLWDRANAISPGIFRQDKAELLNNQARLYVHLKNYETAETLYKDALAIRRSLVADYPEYYKPELGVTLAQQAMLYAHILPNRTLSLNAAKEAQQILEPYKSFLPLAAKNWAKAKDVIDFVTSSFGSATVPRHS